jgi:filamentous hemagglutinin family protein
MNYFNIKIKPILFTRTALYIAVISTGVFSFEVLGVPQNGIITGGTGEIIPTLGDINIRQDSDRMTIDWRSFDVEWNETVNFIQPNNTSIVLNRVIGDEGSRIFGKINANGQVFIVNSNGIVFGKGSVLNVGGLVASGLSIDPTSFINGDLTFNHKANSKGTVENSGIINAASGGSVALIGLQVKNHGLIYANLGSVALAAGKQAVLTFDNTGLLGVKVTEAVLQNELGVDAAVLNSGAIESHGGRVLLTASQSQDVFSNAVNHSGFTHETAAVIHTDGSFSLGGGADVIITGNIDVSIADNKSGHAIVLGENITHSGNIIAENLMMDANNSIQINETLGSDTALSNITLSSGNSISVVDGKELNTNGGSIVIGSAANETKTVNLSNAMLNTTGDNGSGDVRIYASDSVSVGTVTLGDSSVSQTPEIMGGSLLVESEGVITLANDIYTSSGNIQLSGNVNITQNISIGAGTSQVDSNITISGTVNSDKDISLRGNNISLLDSWGETQRLGHVNINALGSVNFKNNADQNSYKNITAKSFSLNAEKDFKVGDISTSFNDENAGSITITAANIDINNINASGGAINSNGNGKNGGSVDITGNQISLGQLLLNGSSGRGPSNRGGSGGDVTVNADGVNNSITLIGDINTDGGGSGNSKGANGSAKFSLLKEGEINLNFINSNNSNNFFTSKIDLTASDCVVCKKTINGPDNDSFWTLESDGSGTISKKDLSKVSNTTSNISYTGFTQFISGANKVNSIKINGDENNWVIGQNLSVSINDSFNAHGFKELLGGSGNDIFKFTDNYVYTHELILAGGDGKNEIIGWNSDLTWRITGGDSGEIRSGSSRAIRFSQIQNLTGGTSNDTFEFFNNDAKTSGIISGGSGLGLDKLIGRNQESTWLIDGENKGSVQVGSDVYAKFVGIENLTGNKSNDTFDLSNTSARITGAIDGVSNSGNTLIGRNSASEWVITGANEGAVNSGNLEYTNFKNIQNLSGGSRNDTFDLTHINAQIDGKINGGLGTDTLKGRNEDSFWIINNNNEGTVENSLTKSYANFIAVENLTGGTAKDIFTFNKDQAAITGNIDGGLGINTLIGQNRNSIWEILLENKGSVKNDSLTYAKFNRIDNLTGGTENDIFDLSNTNASITGSIKGGDGIDELKGRNQNSTWVINDLNSGSVQSENASYATFLDIENLTGGSSTDIFDLSHIAAALSGGIKGGDGSGIDTLIGRNQDSEWEITGNNKGTISNSSKNYVVFSEIENITGGIESDIFNLSHITASISGLITGGDGTAIDTIKGRNQKSDWTISDLNTGAVKNDSFTYASFRGIETLHGGDQSDFFNLSNSHASITGSIDGGSGSAIDTLKGRNENNLWIISDKNKGSLTSESETYADFLNIESLIGGTQTDTFNFSALTAEISGTIDGGDGLGGNTLIGRNQNNEWIVTAKNTGKLKGSASQYADFTNIGYLVGGIESDIFDFTHQSATITGNIFGGDGNALDTLKGRNENNNWEIIGTDTGSVKNSSAVYVNFSGIKNITGGAGADLFDLSNANAKITGEIIGGDGPNIDTINARHENNKWIITHINKGYVEGSSEIYAAFSGIENLNGGTGDDTFDISAITAGITGLIDGGAGLGINKLHGRNQASEWNIINTNQGSIHNNSNTYASFKNIQDLLGGTENDLFNFSTVDARITGVIHGGSGIGIDTLKGSNKNSVWEITEKNQGLVKSLDVYGNFIDIENITGGTANDTFDFSNSNALITGEINGGEGDDTLKGRIDNNTWSILGQSSGIVTTTDTILRFTDIENLTGSSFADIFIFSDNSSIKGLIDGGISGNNLIKDTVDLSALKNGVSVDLEGIRQDSIKLKNIEIISANDSTQENNILFGASDQSYLWNINGYNKGIIQTEIMSNVENSIEFNNFGDIRGGKNNDSFKVNGVISKSISGGDGNGIDTIDYSGSNNKIDIHLSGSGVFPGVGISGIEKIKGTFGNGGFASTIYVSSGNATFNIGSTQAMDDGINDGNVTLNGNVIYFENFNNINASNGNNTFNYLSNGLWNGEIIASGQNNIINSSASLANQVFQLSPNVSLDYISLDKTFIDGISEIRVNSATANNLIGNDIKNIWTIDSGGLGLLNNAIKFSGFSSLTGGNLDDDFIFSNINQLKGTIDGGDGKNSINISGVNKAISVSNNISKVSDLKISNINILTANNNYFNKFYAKDEDNNWIITGENSGSLNYNLKFEGFSILYGGKNNDHISYESDSSVIKGYINLGDGNDTVDTSKSSQSKNFVIRDSGEIISNSLVLVGVENLIDNKNNRSSLFGKDINSNWRIENSDEGLINFENNGSLSFFGVKNLIGGSGDDTFTFGIDGSISGFINGGSSKTIDTVDVSNSKTVNIEISASANTGFSNIEKYIGNSITTTITADNIKNQWNISGTNAGTINDNISFGGMVSLFGGSNVDIFNISQASITGQIDSRGGNDEFNIYSSNVTAGIWGGEGDDSFNIEVDSKASWAIDIKGGSGVNTLTMKGGDSSVIANHYSDNMSYSSDSINVLDVKFNAINLMYDTSLAKELVIHNHKPSQQILYENNYYRIGDFSKIYFSNKSSLNFLVNDTDTINILGDVYVSDTLTFNDALINTYTGTINAKTLQLIETEGFGNAHASKTKINNLIIKDSKGPINILEENDISIKGMSLLDSNYFRLEAGGTISFDDNINYSGDLYLTSASENINLSHDNNLSGGLNLNAFGNINLTNDTFTKLLNINSKNLNVTSKGDIYGDGKILVLGNTKLESLENIELKNYENNFNNLSATGKSIHVYEFDGFITNGLRANNIIDLKSNGKVEINYCIESCSYGLGISSNNVFINANGIFINSLIESQRVDLESKKDSVSIGVNGKIKSNGSINVTTNDFDIYGGFLASGDINIVAKDNIIMGSGSSVESINGNINYSAGSIDLGLLKALNGIITTTSNKNIKDGNGSELNIQAKHWNAFAQTGIGYNFSEGKAEENSIETDVDSLYASNAGILVGVSSSINISEKDAVTINRLVNNGNIYFSNATGDITLDKRDNPYFDPNKNDAREQGAVINTNKGISGGNLSITIGNGSIISRFDDPSIDMTDMKNPDIFVENGFFNFLSSGNLGKNNRKIVMSVTTAYDNNSTRSYIRWYDKKLPIINNDKSKNLSEISLYDQLIKIEELSDLNPAIFTNIKNYVSDDIAILLPEDQRFDNDELLY